VAEVGMREKYMHVKLEEDGAIGKENVFFEYKEREREHKNTGTQACR